MNFCSLCLVFCVNHETLRENIILYSKKYWSIEQLDHSFKKVRQTFCHDKLYGKVKIDLTLYSFGGALAKTCSNSSAFTQSSSKSISRSFNHSWISFFRHDRFGETDSGVKTLCHGALSATIAIFAVSPTVIDGRGHDIS